MSTPQPLTSVVRHNGFHCDLELWAKRKVQEMENLSEQQVFVELQDIMMEGHNYSWHCINTLLQARLDEGSLEFSDGDGEVLLEWNNLCDIKRRWEKKGYPAAESAEFDLNCLINLKILPFKAGLGSEAPKLVTSNMDELCVSTADLWVGPRDPESLRYQRSKTDSDASSESEESEYLDEEEESDLECEDVESLGFDEENMEDQNWSDDESTGEESEDSDNSSHESDEVENEDEDIGLNVVFVEFEADPIFDLEEL